MVGSHSELDAVDGLVLFEGFRIPSVVYQDVQFVLSLVDVLGETPDRCEGAQVEFLDENLGVLRCVDDFICNLDRNLVLTSFENVRTAR